MANPIVIAKSSEFRAWKITGSADLLAFALAGIAAIVSGLAIYGKAPTFGSSMQDYIALFTWGAGIDQGKNFIQALTSNTTTKP